MNKSARRLLLIALILIPFAVLAALMTGSARLPVGKVAEIIFKGGGTNSERIIVLSIRLPRILTALVTGMALAGSGCAFQAVFSNDMADPYVLGISSGSAFSVALATALGITGHFITPVAAFSGALLVSFIILFLGRRSSRELILTGIAFNFFFSSLQTLVMFIDRKHTDSILYWTLGSLSTSSWTSFFIAASFALPATIALLSVSTVLDMLLEDETSAISQGLDIRKARTAILIVSTLQVAASVAFNGIIGFVGLMAPHITRRIAGSSHRSLLPCSLALGALMLLTADTVARIILPSGELPVGVITALFGAPVFLTLLKKRSSL